MAENVHISEEYAEAVLFQDLNLPEPLLKGIFTHGFEKPSTIQARAIRPVIDGRDTLAQAQSGTGKTATFVIGCLSRIDKKIPSCQALILAPTRELAIQITRVAENIGLFLDVRVHACIGGTSVRDDIDKLRQGQHMVVGCPGRVYDMISRNYLGIDRMRIFVLDEADEMLSRGFTEQIYKIFKALPSDVQVCLFSATMPKETVDLTEKFMRDDTVRIFVKSTELTLEGIRQYYIQLDDENDKFETLCELYERLSVHQSIIYCNTKRRVEKLGQDMLAKDFTVSLIHAELLPAQREQVMTDFRTGATRVMISTDLLARGIDVQQISVVINYDMPVKDIENYLHRIGRSGRYGRKGLAINFVLKNDHDILAHKRIEDFYKTHIEEMPADVNSLL